MTQIAIIGPNVTNEPDVTVGPSVTIGSKMVMRRNYTVLGHKRYQGCH